MLFITSLYRITDPQQIGPSTPYRTASFLLQLSFNLYLQGFHALSSYPLRRLRLAMLRTSSVISALTGVILYATNAPLDTLGLVSDLLSGLGLDGLGVLGGGADAFEPGVLALAAAGLHAVQLVARLALDRLAVLGLVVDGLTRGSREYVECPRA